MPRTTLINRQMVRVNPFEMRNKNQYYLIITRKQKNQFNYKQ